MHRMKRQLWPAQARPGEEKLPAQMDEKAGRKHNKKQAQTADCKTVKH